VLATSLLFRATRLGLARPALFDVNGPRLEPAPPAHDGIASSAV
jgi:hypothetical protein